MTITLGNTTLVAGLTRNNLGNPVGPSNFRMTDAPGVVRREYVGADRIRPEHVKCDAGTINFDVTRTFASEADALSYIAGAFLTEASEGELKLDNTTVFAHAAVTSRSIAHKGCSVAISYTIEG